MFISTLLAKTQYDSINGCTNMFYRLSFNNYKKEPVILGYLNNVTSSNRVKETGSYILIINSENNVGATGIFCLSRSDKSQYGNVKELCSSDGVYNEKITVEWDPYEYPKIILHIHKLKTDKKDILFSFNIKIVN